jgi:hypothetical protein
MMSDETPPEDDGIPKRAMAPPVAAFSWQLALLILATTALAILVVTALSIFVRVFFPDGIAHLGLRF